MMFILNINFVPSNSLRIIISGNIFSWIQIPNEMTSAGWGGREGERKIDVVYPRSGWLWREKSTKAPLLPRTVTCVRTRHDGCLLPGARIKKFQLISLPCSAFYEPRKMNFNVKFSRQERIKGKPRVVELAKIIFSNFCLKKTSRKTRNFLALEKVFSRRSQRKREKHSLAST